MVSGSQVSHISRSCDVADLDRFYFITSGASIHVHSSVPGFKRLSTLSSTDREGHKGKITGLQLHPTNPLQLLSCGSDGTVKAWDWAEDRLVRTITITERGSVGHMCTGQVGEKWYIFATAAIWKDDGGGKVDGKFADASSESS